MEPSGPCGGPPYWRAWMRGTDGMGADALEGLFPEIGPAAAALEFGGLSAYAPAASGAVSGSSSREEASFVAYRLALQHVADRAAAGSPYRGGLPRVLGSLYGPAEVPGMSLRALADLPSVMAPSTPAGLAASGDSLLELCAEASGLQASAEGSACVAALLAAGADGLVAFCLRFEQDPGFSEAMERVSLAGLFGRLMHRALSRDRCPAPGEALVRDLSAMMPSRWEDGASEEIDLVYSLMCAFSGSGNGGFGIGDMEGVYIDMSGCPGARRAIKVK